MTEDDNQKKRPQKADRGPWFEVLYKKPTSDKVKKASDELFSASEDDLKKAFQD